MKFAADFDTFLRNQVNLPKRRLVDLDARVNAIRSFLETNGSLSEMFIDVIPTGSWAHRTIIRPVQDHDEFDADILLHMTHDPSWLAKDYVETVFGAFASSGVYGAKAKKMTRCVRIDYAGDVHVDVVPYLELGDAYVVTNWKEPPEQGRYEPSNPEAFAGWVDERQRLTLGNFIKVVRLVKYLRDFKQTFSCKSIILTTLLGETVQPSEEHLAPQLYTDVPTALRTMMRRLADSLPPGMPAVYDPADTGDDFTERYRYAWNYVNFRKQIVYYADKIDAAFVKGDSAESTRVWREIFGASFREATATTASVVAKDTASASVSWDGEQFIDADPFDFPKDFHDGAKLRISARCTGLYVGEVYLRNGFRQFRLAGRGGRVPKNRSLTFTATTNVPGVTLYWKVRNGGQEAAETTGGLRGEIRKDSGGSKLVEHTSYAGKHYVECYAVLDGAVVAMDHQVVIVTG